MTHRMRCAFPSRATAKRYGLSRNHSLRVWCECQASLNWESRPSRDQRVLGGWDWLGVVDVREPGSARALWEQHVREAERDRATA